MLHYLRNLSSSSAEPLDDPSSLGLRIPDSIATKEEYRSWAVNPATEHAFVSAYEGLSPVVRIGKDNPPVKLHGLVVDYDFRSCTTDMLRDLATKPPSDMMPLWGSMSFSKGAKLYWEFERPIPVSSGIFIKKLSEKLTKELKLQSWLPGFDAGISAKPEQYYEIGCGFTPIGKRKIPHAMLSHWVVEAMREVQLWHEWKRFNIPLDEVEKQVNEQFPGRWRGTFQVGSRGVRFWDPSADNPTGAMVRLDGMMCFTGDKAFMSWLDIFGPAFANRFAASKNQVLLDSTYYDGKCFYTKASDEDGGKWTEWDKADFSQKLRTMGFDPARSKGATHSELDMAEIMIKEQRKVDVAGQLVHFPKGPLVWRGKKYLNMGAAEPVRPAPPLGAPLSWEDGAKHFPFIHGFLDTLFTDRNGEDSHSQRLYLLAWLKRFYEGGLECSPTQGQMVLLAGPANKGKSLFSEGIVGGLMGGCADGSDHFVDNSRWTANLASSPVIYVGDATATTDHKTSTAFSNLVKKYVANASMHMAQKFKNEGDVPWFGRIVVSCNEDSESLQILPNMDISSREKISLFKASDVQYPFPDRREIEKALARELPFFGRFLIDWKYPERTVPTAARFGVEHFHHPELYDAAVQQGASGILAEMIREFVQLDASKPGLDRKFWRGTAAQLYSNMSETNPQVAKEFRSTRSFLTTLGQVKGRGSVKMESSRDQSAHGRPVVWTLWHPVAAQEDPT